MKEDPEKVIPWEELGSPTWGPGFGLALMILVVVIGAYHLVYPRRPGSGFIVGACVCLFFCFLPEVLFAEIFSESLLAFQLAHWGHNWQIVFRVLASVLMLIYFGREIATRKKQDKMNLKE